jgi:electron transfer flavoprotein alpha subunit
MAKLLLISFDSVDAAAGAGFAQDLGLPFDLLQISGEPELDLGAERVLAANLAESPPADALARALAPYSAGYSHVAAVSAMRSKDVMARLAGLLDAAMITDAVACHDPKTFVRPMVAGSVLATVQALAEPVVLTVRPAGFAKPERKGSSEKTAIDLAVDGLAKRVDKTSRSGGRPDLTQAKVIVSGGRPLGDAATFERVIGGMADALGGAAGATRAAVDSGIAANELQVGQTGKIVAPDLYIAAGISGSTQHMAGIKDSKVIVAINKDPDAPIFQGADLGLVADLFETLPALRAALGK